MTDAQWVGLGLFGQTAFGARFMLQWIASERQGKSVMPISFWYLSVAGSAIVLSYGLHKLDPVIIVGQSMGFVVYVRNLVLLRRQRSFESAVRVSPGSAGLA